MFLLYLPGKLNHAVSPNNYKRFTLIAALLSLAACSGGSSGDGPQTVCRNYASQTVQSSNAIFIAAPPAPIEPPLEPTPRTEICEWSESALTLSCTVEGSNTVTSYASTQEFVLEKYSLGTGRFIDSVQSLAYETITTRQQYSDSGLLEQTSTHVYLRRNTVDLNYTDYDDANRPTAGVYRDSSSDVNVVRLSHFNRDGATLSILFDDEALTRQEDISKDGVLISSVLLTFDEDGNLIRSETLARPVLFNPPTTNLEDSPFDFGDFEPSTPGYWGYEEGVEYEPYWTEYTITATDEVCFTQ
jgi:hypothetical protein